MKKYLFILILFSMFCVMAEPVLAQDQPITGGLSAGCISNGNCELSDFMRVFLNVARFILGLSGSVALLAFVIGGFMMMASGGNKNMIDRGKAAVSGAAIGLVIVFTSWMLIGLIITKIAGGNTAAQNWFKGNWFTQN